VLQDAFFTILTKIRQFREKGSFEGWMKKITLNTALMQLRKDKKEIISQDFDITDRSMSKEENSEGSDLKDTKSVIENAQFSQNEIFDTVSQLPPGFRAVFNLYVIEGYKHKEIAKELNISIGTSKSQLLRARKRIEKLLYQKAVLKLKMKNTR
jgi:RNA polymerase sigma-70 factor (ECF subfamily)